jgi:soluble lytic murein transglycosylase
MKFIALIALLFSLAVQAASLEQQRQLFRTTYAAAIAGVAPRLPQLRSLQDYPLYPYLRYYQIRPRLRTLPSAEVRQFLTAYPASLLSARLRTDWLKETARQGRFDLFGVDYAPQTDPELRCHALRIKLRDRTPPSAVRSGLELWLSGKSQPAACDPVFTTLHARKVLTEDLIWQRILLSAHAGDPRFGLSIAKRYAGPSDRALAELLVRAWNTPATTLQIQALRHDTPRMRGIVGYGLSRLARQSVTRAAESWQQAQSRYQFTPVEAGFVTRAIALAAATQKHPRLLELLGQVNPAGIDDTIERLQLQEGLRARAWSKLVKWTAAAPRGATTNALRWRYWQARALAETGAVDQAKMAFTALATERDYYGFMASDKLGVPYAMTHRAIAPTTREQRYVNALGGIRRAREFYQLKLPAQASSELDFELASHDRRTQEVLAAEVNAWGWHARAIRVLGQIQSYDDLDLRFPLLHRPLVDKFARQRDLKPSLIYSIIRGESAFVTDARSVAGALGLMQVMPATGAMTAKHLGLSLRSPTELTQVEKNLAIGSEYLRQVVRQFGGSFPLAAAAYNAGPGRVKGWLKNTRCAPADVWIDTIPFAETEAYVRRALFYAAIYEARLGVTVTSLANRMAGMTPHAHDSAGQC